MAILFEMTRAGRSQAERQGSSERVVRRGSALLGLRFWLVASLALGACSLDPRKPDVVGEALRPDAGPAGASGARGENGETACAAGDAKRPTENEGAECVPGRGQEGPPAIGGVQPVDGVSGETNASCDGDGGSCAPTGDAGSGCVATGPRDCSSDLDNDCDGQPDNVADDVCVCAPGNIEPCEEHAGLDGRGQCRPGSRTCILGEGNLTSNWGACEGSVGPGAEDSCAVVEDDTNCDGTNNGGCPCIEGEQKPCGPATENGICQRGSQTCVDGSFGQCVGAVFAAARDCTSDQDNDCDGRPDNTVDNVCTCIIGSAQACGTHPGRDGNGQCRAGSQTCAGRANNATSTFGACTGSVGPALQDTCVDGNDANCNRMPNEGCACINGQTRGCGPDTEVGPCQRGTQTCVSGAFGECQGEVFPAPRNCASPQDNDCDGRPDNTFDNVCLPPQNPFTCNNASPPATVLPFNLMSVDSQSGQPIFPTGRPPGATGGTVRNGRYVPTRVDVYGRDAAPAFAVFEMTFEFRDGFVQLGYQIFVGTGAVLGSAEVRFVGTATSSGTSLRFDVDGCDASPCTTFDGLDCIVPASLSYSAAQNSLVTIQPASDGSTVVITYSRQ